MKNIWGPLYNHSTCEELSDNLIREAEARFNCKLPSSYLELLRFRNGGFLRNSKHPKLDVEINPLFGIGHESSSIFDTDWDYYVYENGKEIPFPDRSDRLIQLCGDGHYYICLDYRNLGEAADQPFISYIGTESGSDFVVADSFAAFIGALEYNSYHYEYALLQPSRFEELCERLEASLNLEFENLLDNPGFHSLRGRIVGEDYIEKVDPDNPNFRSVSGSFDMVWVVPNVQESGYILHPDIREADWILKIGDNVLKPKELMLRLESQNITAKLAHVPSA